MLKPKSLKGTKLPQRIISSCDWKFLMLIDTVCNCTKRKNKLKVSTYDFVFVSVRCSNYFVWMKSHIPLMHNLQVCDVMFAIDFDSFSF